eukprot:scaffold86013_cov33-Phaeocystis_antarctica.AAC.1
MRTFALITGYERFAMSTASRPSLFALREMRRASATVCSLGLRASPALRAALSFKQSRPHRMSPGPLSAAASSE